MRYLDAGKRAHRHRQASIALPFVALIAEVITAPEESVLPAMPRDIWLRCDAAAFTLLQVWSEFAAEACAHGKLDPGLAERYRTMVNRLWLRSGMVGAVPSEIPTFGRLIAQRRLRRVRERLAGGHGFVHMNLYRSPGGHH